MPVKKYSAKVGISEVPGCIEMLQCISFEVYLLVYRPLWIIRNNYPIGKIYLHFPLNVAIFHLNVGK